MKNFLLITTAILLMTACNLTELANANNDKDSLTAVVGEREAALNEFVSAFNDVERNLDSVAVKQHIVTVNSNSSAGELMKPNQKARINDEIAAINTLMDQNRKKIAALNSKLKGSA